MSNSRPSHTDRLDEKLSQLKSNSYAFKSTSKKTVIDKKAVLLADKLGGEVISNQSGNYCKITKTFPIGYSLGRYMLEKPATNDSVCCSSFTVDDSDRKAALSDLLFFDTETTGLGGAGAVAFLIGFGSLTSNGFEIRQYLLPDYPDETAMLEETLNEFSDSKTLVSYNGAAFDINLVRDRMIVNRVGRQIPYDIHIDLLHSTRRLFKRRLKDCSLQNIERELFGFFREGDIQGYLIPSVYFEWLNGDETDALKSVLEHNQIDILSLYFLLKLIDSILSTDGSSLDESDDIYSLSRLFGRRRQTEKILINLSRLNELEHGKVEDDSLLFHSIALKRSGQWSQAEEIWLGLTNRESKESLLASLELAKLYEHRVKDFKRAIKFAIKAKNNSYISNRLTEAVANRLIRLESKEKV